MEIEYLTDVGRKRSNNEDYVAVFTNQVGIQLAILADGMGGHLAGDVASRQAVNELGSKWEENQIDTPELATQWCQTEIQAENQRIYQAGKDQMSQSGMGTTVVLLILFKHLFTIAHVGDSRGYLIRDQKITQLTDDHSLVNELVKTGEITQEMAAVHPQRNVLLQSVGMPEAVKVDVATQSYQNNDYLLLASDGLTNMVSDEEILTVIQADLSLKAKVEKLIDLANQAGGKDNITVLIVSVGGVASD